MDKMPEKVVRRSKIAEGLAALAVAVALITSLSLYAVNNRANNRNKEAIEQINQNRIAITYNSCIDQNQRHKNSIAFIKKLGKEQVKKGKATEAELKEAIQNYEFLFNALAPIKDCKKLVLQRYGELPAELTSKKK